MVSSLPKVQRKRHFAAPMHDRRRRLGAALSEVLRKSLGVRTLSLRKGDTVKIMRGDHKGKIGKITEVDSEKYKVYIEGVTTKRSDKSDRKVPIHASNVMITDASTSDKFRVAVKEKK